MDLLKWTKNAGIFALLSVVIFYAFHLAVVWAPIFVPAGFSGRPSFFLNVVVPSLVAAIAVGLVFGFVLRCVFPANSMLWALACSGSVALVYLGFAYEVRMGRVDAVMWPSILDAALFVLGFLIGVVKLRKSATDVI